MKAYSTDARTAFDPFSFALLAGFFGGDLGFGKEEFAERSVYAVLRDDSADGERNAGVRVRFAPAGVRAGGGAFADDGEVGAGAVLHGCFPFSIGSMILLLSRDALCVVSVPTGCVSCGLVECVLFSCCRIME